MSVSCQLLQVSSADAAKARLDGPDRRCGNPHTRRTALQGIRSALIHVKARDRSGGIKKMQRVAASCVGVAPGCLRRNGGERTLHHIFYAPQQTRWRIYYY